MNNSDNRYTDALDRNTRVFKYFLTGSPYREELPAGEDAAAAA